MLVLVCVTLCLLSAAAAVFPDVEVTCISVESCVLPCQRQQALSMIIWYRNQTPLAWLPDVQNIKKPNNRTSLLHQELHDGICSLLIKKVMPQDSGIYKCDTVNKGLVKTSQYYNLRVNVPVKEVVIEESGDYLICSSENIYPRPQCQWTSAVLNSTVAQGNQGVLFTTRCITERMHNASNQSCTVSSRLSSHTNTYIQRPAISVSGTEAVLLCAHTTSPVKTESWRFNHNETIVSLSGEVSEGWRPFVKSISDSRSLTLNNLTSHQQGRFTCVTRTDTESYTVVTQLQIRGAPGAPGLSVFSVISIVFTAVLTIFASGAYRRSQCSSANHLPQRDSSQTKVDSFNAAWIICGLLGLSSALPCFFVIASLYFQHRLSQNWTMNVLILVNQVTLIPEVCNSVFVLRCSAQKHIMTCFAMISVMFVVVLIAMKVPMAEETFFTVSMCAHCNYS
uniref:Ig-like domain-containing protein n=1 Tax=Knipowitschia caucasica TaxID=637954 RepID=A0AAV2L909_KNICA